MLGSCWKRTFHFRNAIQSRWLKPKIYCAYHHAQNNDSQVNRFFKDDGNLLHLTDDEDKQMAVLLQKNYALESLPDIREGGDLGAIFNEAGRRYLWCKTDHSISKSVDVLSAVSNSKSTAFYLLEESEAYAIEVPSRKQHDSVRSEVGDRQVQQI
jgi:hypothetical protein